MCSCMGMPEVNLGCHFSDATYLFISRISFRDLGFVKQHMLARQPTLKILSTSPQYWDNKCGSPRLAFLHVVGIKIRFSYSL